MYLGMKIITLDISREFIRVEGIKCMGVEYDKKEY
jgi:hypothetical protein